MCRSHRIQCAHSAYHICIPCCIRHLIPWPYIVEQPVKTIRSMFGCLSYGILSSLSTNHTRKLFKCVWVCVWMCVRVYVRIISAVIHDTGLCVHYFCNRSGKSHSSPYRRKPPISSPLSTHRWPCSRYWSQEPITTIQATTTDKWYIMRTMLRTFYIVRSMNHVYR